MKLDYKKWFRKLTTEQRAVMKKLCTTTKKELEKHGIRVFVVPNISSPNGYYDAMLPWSDIDDFDSSMVMIVLDIDVRDKTLAYSYDQKTHKPVQYVQHMIQGTKDKKIIKDIMKYEFGAKFQWNGRTTHNMKIIL